MVAPSFLLPPSPTLTCVFLSFACVCVSFARARVCGFLLLGACGWLLIQNAPRSKFQEKKCTLSRHYFATCFSDIFQTTSNFASFDTNVVPTGMVQHSS